MKPEQQAIIDILTYKNDGLTQAQIKGELILKNVIPNTAEDAVVWNHLNDKRDGLIALGRVWRTKAQGQHYTYHILPVDLEGFHSLETNNPDEFDAAVSGLIEKYGFDAICAGWSRHGCGNGNGIVVIPGNANPPCSTKIIVLANHQNGKGAESWSKLDYVVTTLKARMIRCIPKTEIVEIITDFWDASEFAQHHASELKVFHLCHNVQIRLRVVSPDRHQSGLVPVY
jgi:hypothetical protein